MRLSIALASVLTALSLGLGGCAAPVDAPESLGQSASELDGTETARPIDGAFDGAFDGVDAQVQPNSCDNGVSLDGSRCVGAPSLEATGEEVAPIDGAAERFARVFEQGYEEADGDDIERLPGARDFDCAGGDCVAVDPTAGAKLPQEQRRPGNPTGPSPYLGR